MEYEIRIKDMHKGYFRLMKMSRANHTIDYLLNKHNINLDDYLLMKRSGNFKFINIEDIDKWSGIICFRKDIYCRENIELWLNFLYKDLKISLNYLDRPFPPIQILNKIKIVE